MQEFSQREWNGFAPMALPEAQVGVGPMGASETRPVYSLRALSAQEFSQRERGGFAPRDDFGGLVEVP